MSPAPAASFPPQSQAIGRKGRGLRVFGRTRGKGRGCAAQHAPQTICGARLSSLDPAGRRALRPRLAAGPSRRRVDRLEALQPPKLNSPVIAFPSISHLARDVKFIETLFPLDFV